METGEARTTEEAQKPEETRKPGEAGRKPGEAGTQEVCRKVCLEASRKPTQEIPQ
jgi:hypothetical protein